MEQFEEQLHQDLHQFLQSTKEVDERLPECPDVEDKWEAKKSKWRIRETALLGLAVLGGSIGAWLGMKVWHHKTQHKGGNRDIDNIVGGSI